MTNTDSECRQPQNRNGAPTLSLCMIVKNEEKFLPQCLESVKDVVDEMVIVDTGSTDRTVEIAERYGAQIYHHAWQNSFSEARNYGLQFATCDWIFQLDGDEELVREDIPLLWDALRSAHPRGDVNALFVAIYNDLSDQQQSKHYFQRIYRRGKAHYKGIVHNQLVYDGKPAPTEVRIRHYGYALGKEEMAKKQRRTGDLLRKQLDDNDGNTFAQMNYVRIFRNQEDFDGVVEQGMAFLDKYRSQMTSMHYQMISNDVAYGLMIKGRYDEAKEVCRDVLGENRKNEAEKASQDVQEKNPKNLDILFTMGAIHSRQGDYPEALKYYQKFIRTKREDKKRPEFTQLIVDTYTIEDKAWNNIGECYKNMELFDQAVEAYLEAIRLDERDVVYYRNLAYSYIQMERLDKAEETFKRAIELGIADDFIHFKLGEVYRVQDDPDRAMAQYDRALTVNEGLMEARNAMANVLMAVGRIEEAEHCLQEAEHLAPNHVGVLLGLARLESGRGRREETRSYIDRIAELNSSDKALSLDLASITVACQDYDRAIELFEDYLRLCPTDVKALTDLSTCYAKMGQYSSALTGYQAALQMNPQHQPARDNLAAMERVLRGAA